LDIIEVTIGTAVTSLFSVVTSVLTAITSNATLMIFFVAGLVGIGVSVLRKIKNV